MFLIGDESLFTIIEEVKEFLSTYSEQCDDENEEPTTSTATATTTTAPAPWESIVDDDFDEEEDLKLVVRATLLAAPHHSSSSSSSVPEEEEELQDLISDFTPTTNEDDLESGSWNKFTIGFVISLISFSLFFHFYISPTFLTSSIPLLYLQ